jgi:hypothetical protein
MADIKLFLSLFIFTILFNILLGLFAANSPELSSLEAPAPAELTYTNFISVFFDYIIFVFQIAGATFALLPWWLSVLFAGLNLAMVLILIDLIFPG